MNQELIILGIIVVIAVIGVIAFIVMKGKKKETITEKFDISVNPLLECDYAYLDNVTCPERAPCVNHTQYGGLNPEYDECVTVKDFIDSCDSDIDFKDPKAATLVSKQYCQMLYPNHIEYFTGCKGYLSFGECEQGTEKEIRELYPDTPSQPLWS
jgi:hypothetical protein